MSQVRKWRSPFRSVSSTIALLVVSLYGPYAARASDHEIAHLQAGAARGSIPQQIELGNAYLAGRGVARDEAEAAYWYEKAANSGDPAAQQQIGYFYQIGFGVKRDPLRAVQWFERAVAGGLVSAKVNLGIAFLWGLGVRKDPVFAAQLFREASEKGSGMGASYLGDLYYFGLGVTKSESDALHWFELGSRLHSVPAKLNLALLLSVQSDQKSQRRAVKLLRESAAAGSVAAKHQLGLQIMRKPELARSPEEGIAMLEEAASQGFWRSSIVLGRLSRDGHGLAKDSGAAYYHFRIAAIQGRENASPMLASDIRALSLKLNQAQIKALDEEAEAWAERHKGPLEYLNLQAEYADRFDPLALEYLKGDMRAVVLLAAPDPDGSLSVGVGSIVEGIRNQ
jgi:TPR repeat protein